MRTPYLIYVVTDEKVSGGRSHLEIATAAVAGSADVVQLRAKDSDAKALLETARRIREVTRAKATLFIVNDRLDVAILSGADGVHLGQDDIPVAEARRMVPPGFIIGVSTGTVEEALNAERDGADYLGLGPVFPTTSKDDAGPVCGLELLREVKSAVRIPVVAIGGITLDNAASVMESGADGLAVISAVLVPEDMGSACLELRQRVSDPLTEVRSTRTSVR